MEKAIIINNLDNVAVALSDLKKDDTVLGVKLKEDIPEKHKFAMQNIKTGSEIIKYGYPIGVATKDILTGEHIHSHNLKTSLSENAEYTYNSKFTYTSKKCNITFNGYLREDGSVGIRNRLLIIPTVGCANQAVLEIGKKAQEQLNICDNTILTLTHPYGCSQLGDDAENTAKCICALIKNSNVGGALLVSLGCENNNLDYMAEFLGEYNKDRIRTLNMQESTDEISAGIKSVSEIYEIIKKDNRTPQPISKLTIGMKCGGSDGFSGITANPLCGRLCDKLTSAGAKVILTEVPEMFGAEQILMNRCINKAVFNKSINLIDSFKKYFISHNQVVYENPSPGNKAGGITTLEEKSLGCITKGGFSPVTDILDMYSSCKEKGLSLLWGPGNDIVSITNLSCAGANIVLFTTGRGTPLGAPVPTVKISTNTELAKKKPLWIDYDAGSLLESKETEEETEKLFNFILDIANGKETLNEINGYEEIAIFKNGVTL